MAAKLAVPPLRRASAKRALEAAPKAARKEIVTRGQAPLAKVPVQLTRKPATKIAKPAKVAAKVAAAVVRTTSTRAPKTGPPSGRPKARASARAKAVPVKAPPAKGRTTGKRRVRYVAPAVREVKVKELDPVARCGPDTSVELLYRVDEKLDGRATGVHLVFFDRYGWYCVHGRGCAAVADVHQDLRSQRRSVPRLAPPTRAAGR